MTLHTWFLIGTIFLATSLEVVEMLTIILGVGATRGWAWTLYGAGAGLLLLIAVIVGLGATLTLIPIDVLRVIVGILLLLFGLQWMRAGIFKVSREGFRLLKGTAEQKQVAARTNQQGPDWTAFALSFKGVVLEGLEIAFVVVAFGAATGQTLLAVVGAGLALLIIGGAGALAHSWVERITESVLKLSVGVLLTTYGTFWAVDGLNGVSGRGGASWPLGDYAVLYLLPLYIVMAFVFYFFLKGQLPPAKASG